QTPSRRGTLGRGADRDRRGSATRSRRDQGHRRFAAPDALARQVWPAGRGHRRPNGDDGTADGGDPRARVVVVTAGVLLAIDGDSLAHRAYHALPKSIRWNALVGFANFLMRLWDAEQPESVLVAWDSLETPTYRHQALPEYQSGREFEPSILAQLGMLPALCESFGFLVGKHGGYEADDFLAAAARVWQGPAVVATSDRDAFQLV